LADLDHAIAIGAQAVAAVPDDHPERALYLCNVGIAYRLRFERVGAQADLDDAIGTGEQAVAATTDDHPDRARCLAHLGVAYRLRFERSGVLADLDHAVETAELAVAATPGDFPERAMWLSSLDTAYHRRFQNGGVLADLDLAVESGAQAVAASPPDHHRRGMFLSNLGDVYRLRFEHREVPADLDHAVAYGEQAVAATPDDLPDRGRYLTNLGIAYLRRFEHGAEPSDVDNAVETGKLAVAAVPQDHPERAMFLTNLGTAYHRRFEHRGALADLDDAIETCEQAVAAIPDGHANRAGMLSNLASTYRLRFGRRGLPADLDHAIEMCELAVAATPDHHVDRGMRLSNLGGFYRLRFERGGVLADLDHAVESCERAVAATPDSHPDRCGYLSSLGAAYRLRFDRGRATADLDRAVAAGEQSVATGQPGQANRLSSLGITYQQRFEQGGVLADLDRAIAAGEQAVATTPHDHHDRAAFLSNLVDPYRRRFSLGGARADLDRAVAVGEQAVAATPPDHPYRAHHLANLGIAYRARFQADGRRIDPATFHAVARDVSDAATASPTERARAGGVLGSLARAMGEHAAALELLDAAVAAMPLIPPRESGWADQEYRLGQHSGLVGEAVAVHCAVGDPAGAVVAAELGRGVLLAAQLDSRTDLTDLDHAEPELAQRFRQVRDQLNARDTDTADQTRHRKQLWADHDELLTRIREHPRFARFLMPPRLSDLRPAHGAVVLVNAVEGRGDAIIITSDAAPVVVPLSELRMTDVLANAMALLQATHDDTRLTGALRRQRVLTDVLGWLWTAIVDPALAALPDTGQAQRVWWLPIGLIGLFPLHAAGLPGQPGALDRVVSSYTPTLRALAHSRARPPATTRRQLTVALAHTPGLPDLPGTVAEATDLHPGTPPLTDQDATTGRVLAALPAATWAHFACHAYTDLATPSRGGLRLHDTTLPIPEISRLALAHAELAYLSACSTAHGGVIHVDESIHLASAFQLAGFRHVIASLWPLNDNIAATAARAFYRQLPDAPTAANAADVLRQVTLDLRANHPTRPDLWAPLIHSGP
jgi:tetratricopeptide (TPR) repeat protein